MKQAYRKHLITAILIAVLLPFLAYSIYAGYQAHKLLEYRTGIAKDFSKVNDIFNGMMSVDVWEEKVQHIIIKQIDEFDLTYDQTYILREEISDMLHAVLDKVEEMLNVKKKGFRNRLKNIAVKLFVDIDKLRKQVPVFIETIISNVTKPESMARLKQLAKLKLDELAEKTYDNSQSEDLTPIYKKYQTASKEEFNKLALKQMASIQKEAYWYTYSIMIILGIFVLAWFIIRRWLPLAKVFLQSSIVIGLSILLIGLASPMIEIDARISSLDFFLLGEHITFTDQVLYYQSKSIIDVVQILVQANVLDSVIVGLLILSFSVLLPTLKLLSMSILLWVKRSRNLGFFKWLANKSGKWSMADVMVVAIFMSFVAFDGIFESQLGQLERETKTVSSITTNNTALQAGFILFTCYVVYAILLSGFLERVIKKERETEKKATVDK